MGPQRIPPRARAHVRSRYLKGVVPLIGGEIEGAAEVTVSKKAGALAHPIDARRDNVKPAADAFKR